MPPYTAVAFSAREPIRVSVANEKSAPSVNFAQDQNRADVCWNSKKKMNSGESMMAKVIDNSASISSTPVSIAGPLWPSRPTVVVIMLGSLPGSTPFMASVMELSRALMPRFRSIRVVMSAPSATDWDTSSLKSATVSTITGDLAAINDTSDKISTILPVWRNRGTMGFLLAPEMIWKPWNATQIVIRAADITPRASASLAATSS